MGQLRFLFALWKANLIAAMEYRGAFLSQVVGMALNNAIYFCFWVLFFERFPAVRGWGVREMLVLFGVAAGGFGLAVYLFGNALRLAEVIAGGRLDYYLSLPRPALLHALASRSVASGLGDFLYGCLSFALAGPGSAGEVLRFGLGVVCAGAVFLGFVVLVQSLAFWMGHAGLVGAQAVNALISFALYPLDLFDGTAKLVLFTVLPAAFMGAVPAQFARSFTWEGLAQLTGAALVFLLLALAIFHRGLRRYESGSAVQIEV
jgi:ABC-2 type transport system permease protein